MYHLSPPTQRDQLLMSEDFLNQQTYAVGCIELIAC